VHCEAGTKQARVYKEFSAEIRSPRNVKTSLRRSKLTPIDLFPPDWPPAGRQTRHEEGLQRSLHQIPEGKVRLDRRLQFRTQPKSSARKTCFGHFADRPLILRRQIEAEILAVLRKKQGTWRDQLFSHGFRILPGAMTRESAPLP